MAKVRSSRCFAFHARVARIGLGLTILMGMGCGDSEDNNESNSSVSDKNVDDARNEIRDIENHRLLKKGHLHQYLHSKNDQIAQAACVAAGRIGDPALIPDLVPLLDARGQDVRAAAAFGLGLIGGMQAENALDMHLAKEQ